MAGQLDRPAVAFSFVNDQPGTLHLEPGKVLFHMVNEDALANSSQLSGNTLLLPTRDGLELLRRAQPDRAREIDASPDLTPERICRRYLPERCLGVYRRFIVVRFRFDKAGARAFCRATVEIIGKRLAIVSDNQIVTAPLVEKAVCQRSAIVQGMPPTLREVP